MPNNSSEQPVSEIMDEGYYRCPVCEYPTLHERWRNFICVLCGWEDDGSDEHIVNFGSNIGYSLGEARKNFKEHLTILRPNDQPDFDNWRGQDHLKRVYMALVDAYRIEKTVGRQSRARFLWKGAIITLRNLHEKL